MKMNRKHFQALMSRIHDVRDELGPAFVALYIAGEFPRADLCKDVNKRFRWDLFFSIDADWRRDFMSEVYAYCDDTHLDTALRAIVPPLPRTA